MYARSTTFRGNPGSIDGGVAHVRTDVLPAVQRLEGCVGLSMLVDRHTGLCIVTTSWSDADAMHRSAEAIGPIRTTVVESVQGNAIEVAEWEVGVLHRVLDAPPNAAARVIFAKGPIGATDKIIDGFRAHVVPRVDDLAGFCSISFFANRDTGRYAATTLYEDRQTMNRAKGQSQAMREEFTMHLGMHITEVVEFDVALAHLRVPETV